MAPLYADDEGRLRARPPLAGLVGLRPDAATQAVVIVALGSTSFDGLSRTRFWIDLTRNLGPTQKALLSTVGLVWAVSIVTLAFVGAMRITGRLHHRRHPELTAAFVHSLVPIAFAYALAHYFSLLVFEGQSAIALASDPLGHGWDLFGTAGNAVNFTLVSTSTIAYVQAAGILAGHVAGVVVAHDRALALFSTRGRHPLPVPAARGHGPVHGRRPRPPAGSLMLAHGGAGGAVAEAFFILVPIALFALLGPQGPAATAG